jgi:hypothetical protein
LYNPAPPVAKLTPDFLDSHIPQGYQGCNPCRGYLGRHDGGAEEVKLPRLPARRSRRFPNDQLGRDIDRLRRLFPGHEMQKALERHTPHLTHRLPNGRKPGLRVGSKKQVVKTNY